VVLGTSAGPAVGIDFLHVRELLGGIAQDVDAIFNSFAGGPNDPNGPVSNSRTLAQDSAHLQAAQQKASELANELSNIQNGTTGRDRH
jgi:hypothetical protein